jgi:hypothetical protein
MEKLWIPIPTILVRHNFVINHKAKRCFRDGLKLSQIQVIPDDVNIISDTIRALSSSYDLVFTSGGIGKLIPRSHLPSFRSHT